jgi:glycosyltransferase involved in cell wall biosynthesis
MPGRALIVTYFYPPVGGVGVQRTLKFVTYLPRFGWQPVVLAPRDPAYPLRDPTLPESPGGEVDVHRTLSLEPTRLTRAVSRAMGPSGPRGPGFSQATGEALDVGAAKRSRRALLRPLLRPVLRLGASTWSRFWNALLFPEEAIAWLPSALPVALSLARRRSVDVIYSSSPPATTHLIAGLAAILTRTPWVADFRDPWVGNPFAKPPAAARRGLEARTERWIVAHAAAVVVAVESLRDDFRERYPEFAERFVFIPNGYDRAELADLPSVPAPDPGTFRIVFAGSLYREDELDVFLSGVERLISRRPDIRQRLAVEFVGRVNDANAAVAARHAPTIGDIVRYRGFVPRREALAWMASAQALLQLMPAGAGSGVFVGGKLLEYLAFDRPILAVMPDGEGRRLVDSLPGGRTSTLDPDRVADALEALIDDPSPGGSADPTGRYDRINLTAELAGVLDAVVAAASPSGH